MSVTCIIPGPKVEYSRIALGDKWCFRCRARLPHDEVILVDAEPGWYGPTFAVRCSRCGKDCTRFPS